MPKFEPSILITDCWGSFGNLTFYHIGGRCYYKKKSRCVFPGTDAQNSQLDVHRRALAAWRSLDHSVQLTWNSFAKPVISHKPPYDNKATISGQNLFVSAYHGFYTLGDEHVPSPQAWEPFPAHSLEFQDASVDGTDLRLCFHSYFPETESAGRYQVLTKIQLTKPGYGRKPGLMRNFLASAPCASGDGCVFVTVDNFRERWDLDLDEYQVHGLYVLLDRQAGYRNIHQEFSFSVKL